MSVQAFGLKAVTAALAAATVSGVAVMSAPAQALLITNGTGPTQATTGIIDFNGLSTGFIPDVDPPNDIFGDTPIDVDSSNPGAVSLVDSSGSGNSINPFTGAAVTNDIFRPAGSTGNYLSIVGNNATFTFNQSLKYFGFLWGSIDPGNQNVVEFLSNGTVVNSYNGNSLGISLGNVFTRPTRYVEFLLADIGANVDGVRFTSSGGGLFQIDNVAYRVPTPALLPGLIGLGVAALRKRKAQATEKASAEA